MMPMGITICESTALNAAKSAHKDIDEICIFLKGLHSRYELCEEKPLRQFVAEFPNKN